MYAIFTEHSTWSQSKITEDNELFYELEEFTNQTEKEARESGFKFAHLYEYTEDDNMQIVYNFVTSVILMWRESHYVQIKYSSKLGEETPTSKR